MPRTTIANNTAGIVINSGSGVIFDNSPAFSPTDHFAFEIEVLLVKGSGCILVDNSLAGTTNSYFFAWDGESLAFYVTLGGVSRNILTIQSPAIKINGYNKISVSYNGSLVVIMANGALVRVSAVSGAVGTNSGPFRIGQYFNGAIAGKAVILAYRFYHTPNYTMNSHRMWVFDNKGDSAIAGTCELKISMPGSGTVVPDVSGNGRNGTFATANWTTNVPGKARQARTTTVARTSSTPVTRQQSVDDEDILRAIYCKVFVDSTSLKNTVDGSLVSSWPDKSGRGVTLSTIGSFRPTYYNQTVGHLLDGKPTVAFSGSNLLASLLDATAQPFTLFMVVRATGDVSNQYFADGSTFNTEVVYRLSGGLRAYAGVNVGPITMPLTTWHLISAQFNSTSSSVSLGNTKVAGNAGAFTSAGLTIGNSAGAGGGGVGLFGNIAAAVVAYGVCTAEQEERIKASLVRRYPSLIL